MVDDYGGYKKRLAADAWCAVTGLGCRAHARREFFELQVSGAQPRAAEALRRIAQLYALETVAREMDQAARREHEPVLRHRQNLLSWCLAFQGGAFFSTTFDKKFPEFSQQYQRMKIA